MPVLKKNAVSEETKPKKRGVTGSEVIKRKNPKESRRKVEGKRKREEERKIQAGAKGAIIIVRETPTTTTTDDTTQERTFPIYILNSAFPTAFFNLSFFRRLSLTQEPN
jgi:hypothetical protein